MAMDETISDAADMRPDAPRDKALAERHPILVDLARAATFGGVIWTFVLATLVARGEAPLWLLLSIPSGVLALLVYLRIIGLGPNGGATRGLADE